jgi:Sulfotransferase family
MTASTERADAAAALRFPDFFIVGHHKSGTTALYEMLKRHPQIYMPAVKEPRFFASDLRPLAGPAYSHRIDDYLALFAPARPEQRAGEATPLYLLSETAAEAIAAAAPAAKIVAIFREPASFLRSLHLQFVQAGVETERDLRRALALQEQRRQGNKLPKRLRRPQMLMYSDHVRYREQLRRFEAVFSAQQMLVLIYDDFRADNEATLRRVLRFLDVDDTAPVEPVEANPSVGVRSVRLNDVVRGVYVGRGTLAGAVNTAVKALLPRPARRRALHAVHRRLIYSAPQSPDERLTLELRRRFKGEVQAFGEHLQRDLAGMWGYDRLD